MNLRFKHAVVSLSVVALSTGIATSAWAGSDTTGLRPTLINAPVPISAGADWNSHWAQKDLETLRSSVSMKPDALVSGAYGPDEPISLRLAADVLVHMYGAGGEQGNALDQALKLGLIRTTDFAGGQVTEVQTVPRELFALLLTRALGINGAEDGVPTAMAPDFVDASAIQAKYSAAVALLQAEGLMVGDGEGRFSAAQPVTYAQAVRTMVKVSALTQQKVAKLSGLNPAEATYLLQHKEVTLAGGMAQQPAAPGSASMEVTRLMDRQAACDLDGDGKLDVAAVVVRSTGGTGTFYYLGGVKHDGTPVESAFLGDRIAVQNVRIVGGKVAVDMLTRGATEPMVAQPTIKETRIFEVKNGALVRSEATYRIEGKAVTLVGGIHEESVAPGSASKVVTRAMDLKAFGDLNGDGQSDEATVLVRTTGGSGTFYYLGVALHSGTPVESAFLGDRITVQNVRIVAGKVAVDMLTRGATEPMVAQPTIKETRIFEVKDGALVPSAS